MVPASSPDASAVRADVRVRREPVGHWIFGILVLWAVTAYLVAPRLWEVFYAYDGAFDGLSRVTQTSDGHPGDPINIALEGSEEEVVLAMTAAGWYAADPITFATSLRIVVDSVLRRPDDAAPVSPLYLFGRKEDLAFEQPVAGGPRHRHHVRFWKWSETRNARSVWFGAATYDERAGLSYTTGQVTHHIGPNVDAERDLIVDQIRAHDLAGDVEWIDAFHQVREGRNGGGDPWRTDGRLAVVALRAADPPKVTRSDAPRRRQNAVENPPSGMSSALRSPLTIAPTFACTDGSTKFTKCFAAITLPL